MIRFFKFDARNAHLPLLWASKQAQAEGRIYMACRVDHQHTEAVMPVLAWEVLELADFFLHGHHAVVGPGDPLGMIEQEHDEQQPDLFATTEAP